MPRVKNGSKWWQGADLTIERARELLAESQMFGDLAPLTEEDRLECRAALAARFGDGWLGGGDGTL